MNGLWKPFRKKNPIQKSKTVKIKVKLPHVCKKTTSNKKNFCSNTVFSLYFKIRAKKFPAAETLAFSLDFLFRRDQNHYSNLKKKIMKMCEQILKKTAPQYNSSSLNCKMTAPQYNSNSLNCKNQEKAINSLSYRFAAIKKVEDFNERWEFLSDLKTTEIDISLNSIYL